LSGIAFTDTLPAGMTVATSGPTSTCGGTLTTTAPDQIAFSGGALAMGSPSPTTCTFSVTVTATQPGSLVNTTGAITSTESGPGGTATATLTVNQANTTTTITGDTPDPSVVGQLVTVTYTVVPVPPGAGTPTGNVTVSDGVNSCVGTVAAGSCQIALTTVGARTLTATYAGNTNFNGRTSAGVGHQVNQANTTTTITDDTPDPTVVGQPYTVTASVAVNAPGAGTPTGTITISDGSQTCIINLPATTCMLTSTTAGAKTLTATYSGDASFNGSTSAGVAHRVNQANTTTAITSDNPDPSSVGQAVTVNFTVTPVAPGAGTPTGNVTVSDGVNSCVGTVAAGSCQVALTTVGARTLTATYAGNTNFNGSTSAGVGHQVNQANTLTTITSDNPDPSPVGQNVTVTFTVVAAAPGAGTPTGNVTVSDGVNSCVGTVAAGSCVVALTTAGARTLTATYAGDASFIGSTSAGEPHTVAHPPALTKQFTPNQIPVGATSTLQFTITNSNGYAINSLAFTDMLPAGVTVATSGPTATCGGTLTTTAPDQIAFTGGSVAANSNCQFSVTVTGATFGQKVNTTSAITSANVGTGAAVTAQLKVVAPPALSKSFTPGSIPQGTATSLGFTISNPNTAGTTNIGLTGIGFTDVLPVGLTVSDATVSTCGGTLTVTAATRTIAFSGGSLGVGASCSFSVTVTGAVGGAYTNTVNSVSSNEGGTNTTPATANLTVVAAPMIAKSFSPPNVLLNGVSTLTLSITNPPVNTVALTGVGVNDIFPAGLEVDATPMVTNSCATGVFNPLAGATSISVSGATIPVGTTCNFSVQVKATTNGAKVNTTGAVTSGNGGAGGTATATLQACPPSITVNPASLPSGTVGTAYNQTLSATPGSPDCNFQVISGALPTGVLLNAATGQLSGTPTTSGTSNFTIRATCFGSCTGDKAYTVTINPSGGCPTITLPALPAMGMVGKSYSGSLAGTTPSGTYNFAVISGSLPPGVTLNNIFKVVSGTPTTAGTYNFTIRATRADGCTGSRAYTVMISPAMFAARAGRTARNDYDGDGASDLASWEPKTGRWTIRRSSDQALDEQQLGEPGDVPASADFDGDRSFDLAVWRPADGTWLVRLSASGELLEGQSGAKGDVPVPADYDGDGQADLALWRAAEGAWLIYFSSEDAERDIAFGKRDDLPTPADYDGDGKTDLALFRPTTGHWLIRLGASGEEMEAQWGARGDAPAPADYDGDGRDDLAVWRGWTGEWFIRGSEGQREMRAVWGALIFGDAPAPGDYDGDGKADVAVWRAAEGRWRVAAGPNSSASAPRQR